MQNPSKLVAERIKAEVLSAAQCADELGGPDRPEYIVLMQELAAEFADRAKTAEETDPAREVLEYFKREVNPAFDTWHTGGGCTALGLHSRLHKYHEDKPDGELPYWLITAADGGTAPDSLAEPLAIGFYLPDDEFWLSFDVPNAAAAVTLIKSLTSHSW